MFGYFARILGVIFLLHALKYLTPAGPFFKKCIFFLLRKRLTILDRFGGLWLPETHFRKLAPALDRSLQKWPCHGLPLFMVVRIIPDMHHSSRYCRRYS